MVDIDIKELSDFLNKMRMELKSKPTKTFDESIERVAKLEVIAEIFMFLISYVDGKLFSMK